ncbi:hypothetical protein [Sulfurimonas sp.]|uniref:hypothetical protein n=1 Tax=Sulfurimonas sp. TaxID=2022749 RepID=UPI0025E15B3C|nr:hypothetical protein [Sulfurimonas sp.]
MSIKIKFSRNYYTREEITKEGMSLGNKEYDYKYLPEVMKRLSEKTAAKESEQLLLLLRVSYKLFKPTSITFFS